jgi:hypothetical protein
MTDDELQAVLDQLSAQQAEQTAAIRCALEGKWQDGADTVQGHVLALNPELELDPKTPLYG